MLLPGAEEKLVWSVIPLECGYQALPRFRILDRRKANALAAAGDGGQQEAYMGDIVRLVDLRRDERRLVQVQQAEAEGEEGGVSIRVAESGALGSILILPE